jgi:hypothetical protein
MSLFAYKRNQKWEIKLIKNKRKTWFHCFAKTSEIEDFFASKGNIGNETAALCTAVFLFPQPQH